jgi:probable HAF family extracellular repeat protein
MKTFVGVLVLALGLCVSATRAAEQYALVILDLPAGGTASGANDINASGTVVGWCNLKDDTSRGFRWTPSTPNGAAGSIALLNCLPGDVDCEAERVNVHGHAVGFSRSPVGTDRAVLWTGTTAIDLGLLPGYDSARAEDINDAGEIVGSRRG